MSVPILRNQVLIRPADLQPLDPGFEIIGTFNPAATRVDDDILLLVRVSERPNVQDAGQPTSPRATWESGKLEWVLDTFDKTGVDTRDMRLFRLPNGRVRLRFISHLRLVRLSADGTQIKEVLIPPDLLPREPWEELGLEDPRITKIGDTYYITYVAISRQMGVATALMTTHDFQTFERHGVIFPTENKDVVFLPQKWNEHFVAYHRPISDQWIDAPSVETALSPDAIFWGKHKFLFGPRPGEWDSVKVGAGPPPVDLPQGWLLLYHGVAPATRESPAGHYCVGAVLLEREDPTRLLARSKQPLLSPERSYERRGFVPNIVFPTGALLSEDNENLLLFSGAADEVVSLISLPVQSILEHLSLE